MADYREFAAKIKTKYPAYAAVDDLDLAKKIIEKHPEYASQVTFDDQQSGPAKAPQQPQDMGPSGASGNWGKPEVKAGSLKDELLPSYTAASNDGGGLGRKALGVASDLVSGALRVPAAIGRTIDTQLGMAGDRPQGFTQSLAQINKGVNPKGEDSFLSDLERDPAMLPSLAIGGGAATIGRMALSGLGAGALSAGLHQGQNYSRTGKVDGGEAALEVGLNTVMPVALKGAATVLKAGTGKLKTIISKLAGLDEEALQKATNPEVLQAAKGMINRTGGNLQNVADDLQVKVGGLQNDEANAIASVNARRRAALESQMMAARPGEPISSIGDVSNYDSGMKIEGAGNTANKNAGARFGEAQTAILDAPSGNAPILKKGKTPPSRPSIGDKGVTFGGIEGNQTPFEQTIDNFLSDAGVGKGGKQYGVIGNVSIPPGAINEIRNMKQVFSTGLNTRDMLDQLRLVDNRINFGGVNNLRLFAKGSQEDLAIKNVRARLDDALEQQIGNAAGKNKNAVLAAWQAHREAFSSTRKALETIQDGLGAGTTNHVDYVNRIKNIGVTDLKKIAAQAKTDPDLAPVWTELKKGFYDGIISKGIKDDGIDFNLMKKAWDGIDDDLKVTMLPYQVASHIDDVLSRTNPLEFKGQLLADNNGLVGKGRQGVLTSLENIGSKAKRTDLEDLKKLDDLLGLEGTDRFSEKSKSFYLGKQLGMKHKGELAWFTGTNNGAKLAGAAIGGSLGGSLGGSTGGGEGAGIMAPIGMVAGIAAQSPAGALAAYRILNSIRKGVILSERNVARPMAQAGLTSGRFGRALTSHQFDEEKTK